MRSVQEVKSDSGAVLQGLELSGAGLDPVVLYIDPATGLISKQTYSAGPGQPVIEEIFGDYRVVDGVRVAYSAAVRRGGQQVLERHVTSITINAPLDPALFTRPTP
jgi:hypothetical protein